MVVSPPTAQFPPWPKSFSSTELQLKKLSSMVLGFPERRLGSRKDSGSNSTERRNRLTEKAIGITITQVHF